MNKEDWTKAQICNTFNSVIPGTEFTVESENEYYSGYLPTLDFQTKVLDNGMITFKHYTKPMSSMLVIQKNTALSKQTIFSVTARPCQETL